MESLKNIAELVHIYRWQPLSPLTNEVKIISDTLSRKIPSIAVLAFNNMSGDSEQEYLADGISEDIITALSKILVFTVMALNSTLNGV